MPRKLLAIEPAKLAALELLAADRGDSLQELVDEAIDGLLKKHRRPVTTREMFAASSRRRSSRRQKT
jgi:hypothetical protein